MTARFSIKVDQATVKDAVELFEFVGGNTKDALRIAINQTAPKIKTLASKEIRSQVRLSASYVGGRLVVRKATRSKLSGAIGTPSRGIMLSRFSTDPNIAGDKTSWIRPPLAPQGGIRLKIKPGGSSKGAPGEAAPGNSKNRPFYILLNGGQTLGIAARLVTAGPRGGKLKVFSGPSLSQVFNTVRGEVMRPAANELQVQMIDAMRYILLKKNPPEAVG